MRLAEEGQDGKHQRPYEDEEHDDEDGDLPALDWNGPQEAPVTAVRLEGESETCPN